MSRDPRRVVVVMHCGVTILVENWKDGACRHDLEAWSTTSQHACGVYEKYKYIKYNINQKKERERRKKVKVFNELHCIKTS
jgi:hypothetical protein